MSTAFNTWMSRGLLGLATFTGAGLGYELSTPEEDVPEAMGAEATPAEDAAIEDVPETHGPSPLDPGTWNPATASSENVIVIQPPELDSERSKGLPAERVHDDSYEISRYGRQVLAPAAEFFTTPTSLFLEARGRFRSQYDNRVRERNSIMYLAPEERAPFSRKTRIGQIMRRLSLPREMRNRPLTPDDLEWLRENGAYGQSIASRVVVIPYAIRLGTNFYAFTQMRDDGRNGLGHAETAVMITDTASVTSHIVDLTLWSRGMGQVAGAANPRLVERALQPSTFAPVKGWMTVGGLEGAAKTFDLSHSISIGSNALMIVTGGLRLYSEAMRMERTGKENQSTIFIGAFEMAGGLSSIILSLFLRSRARRIRKSAGTGRPDYLKMYDAYVGFTPFPILIRECVRLPGVIQSSAMMMLYGATLMNATEHMAAGASVSRAFLAPLFGLLASGFTWTASSMNTPGRLSVSKTVFMGTFLLYCLQSIMELG